MKDSCVIVPLLSVIDVFQSPCGEVVVKAGIHPKTPYALHVSVPSRGSGCESIMITQILNGHTSEFQSPCGEVVVKEVTVVCEPLEVKAGWFQSPCGEVVVKGSSAAIGAYSKTDGG